MYVQSMPARANLIQAQNDLLTSKLNYENVIGQINDIEINAEAPNNPRITHTASPTREPICTAKAGMKPPFKPLLMLSTVMVPGAALNNMPKKKADTNNSVINKLSH